jgi:hypothetical protein
METFIYKEEYDYLINNLLEEHSDIVQQIEASANDNGVWLCLEDEIAEQIVALAEKAIIECFDKSHEPDDTGWLLQTLIPKFNAGGFADLTDFVKTEQEKSKGEIYIELCLYKDTRFDTSLISLETGMTPKISYSKGDIIRKNLYWQQSGWVITTNKIHTSDVGEVTTEFIEQIRDKLPVLAKVQQKYSLDAQIEIVISSNIYMPAISLSKEFIALANALNANIEFDIYYERETN